MTRVGARNQGGNTHITQFCGGLSMRHTYIHQSGIQARGGSFEFHPCQLIDHLTKREAQ
jgi:hypothetical protein